jgi:hypothetical protein
MFGGLIINIYEFETACKATSSINIIYGLIFGYIGLKVIKKHFITNPIEHVIDSDFNKVKTPSIAINDRFQRTISFTTKKGRISIIRLSKRNSLCESLQ